MTDKQKLNEVISDAESWVNATGDNLKLLVQVAKEYQRILPYLEEMIENKSKLDKKIISYIPFGQRVASSIQKIMEGEK